VSGGDEGRRWVRGAGHHHLRVLVVLALGVPPPSHPCGLAGVIVFSFLSAREAPPRPASVCSVA
jgi:hypothetical protein